MPAVPAWAMPLAGIRWPSITAHSWPLPSSSTCHTRSSEPGGANFRISSGCSSTCPSASTKRRPTSVVVMTFPLSGVHHAGRLVARARKRVTVEHLDRGVDAQLLLDAGPHAPRDVVAIGATVGALHPQHERHLVDLRLHHDVLEGGLGDLGHLAQGRFQLRDLEALALARQQVLEPPAPQ